MIVQSNVKRYWTRQGPKEIFGYDWQERLEMTDEELEKRFDQAWKINIEPALADAPVLDPAQALEELPDDKRREHFKSYQEHRKIRLCGEEMIVQIDPISGNVTQMWHLHARRPKPEDAATGAELSADDEDDSIFPLAGLSEDSAEAELADKLLNEPGENAGGKSTFEWLSERADLTPEDLRQILIRIQAEALALVG